MFVFAWNLHHRCFVSVDLSEFAMRVVHGNCNLQFSVCSLTASKREIIWFLDRFEKTAVVVGTKLLDRGVQRSAGSAMIHFGLVAFQSFVSCRR